MREVKAWTVACLVVWAMTYGSALHLGAGDLIAMGVGIACMGLVFLLGLLPAVTAWYDEEE